jgi:transposase
LLRALLLQMLYSVRSERLLMEEIDYNILFRWFAGLNLDNEVWDKPLLCWRKVRHRGTLKVDWIFAFACAACNLVRMRNLMLKVIPT